MLHFIVLAHRLQQFIYLLHLVQRLTFQDLGRFAFSQKFRFQVNGKRFLDGQFQEDDTSPEGGRLPYKKDGDACRKFCKETLRGNKILFCGRGLKCFSPLRGSNSYITHYLLSLCFGLIPLKGIRTLHSRSSSLSLSTGTARGYCIVFLGKTLSSQWAYLHSGV